MEQKPFTEPSRAHEEAVERLIELASREKRTDERETSDEQAVDAARKAQLLRPQDRNIAKERGPDMWKALFLLLPQVVPLVKAIRNHSQEQPDKKSSTLEAPRAISSSTDSSHGDLDQKLAEQSRKIEQLEQKISDLRGASEAQLRQQYELITEIRSAQSTLRNLTVAVLLLLLCLIGGAIYAFLQLHP